MGGKFYNFFSSFTTTDSNLGPSPMWDPELEAPLPFWLSFYSHTQDSPTEMLFALREENSGLCFEGTWVCSRGVIILSGLEAMGLDCSLPRLCHWFAPSCPWAWDSTFQPPALPYFLTSADFIAFFYFFLCSFSSAPLTGERTSREVFFKRF